MKLNKIVSLVFLSIMFISAHSMAEEPTIEWVKHLSVNVNANVRNMAIDDSGNTYVVGGGSTEGFVTIKYDTDGNERWVRKYISGSISRPNAVAVDSSGNVYVVGGSGYYGNWNITTIKYDSDGNELWVKTYSGDWAFNIIAVDASGNVYVTGSITHNDYWREIVTIKYDTDGNELWVKKYSNGSAIAYSNAVDSTGNVYVTGNGGGLITTIKYDTNGNELWVKRYTAYGSEGFSAVKLDSSGNVYVGGAIGRWDAAYNYVIIKYDSDGNELWVRLFNSGSYSMAGPNCLSVDSAGNAFMTVIGFVPYYYDYVTVKYDANGNLLWVNRHSGDSGVYPIVDVDSFGNVYVAGGGPGSNGAFTTVKYQANGEMAWVKIYDEVNTFEVAAGIKVDPVGNVYIAGTSGKNWTWETEWVTIKYKQCMSKADAGPDQIVDQTSPDGGDVVLDGSASVGTDLVYNWTWPGGSATGPNPMVFLPAGVTEVTLEVSNGTCRATDTVSITVHDGIPPVTKPIVTGIHGSNDWYISDVIVTFTATDSESGVARTEYSPNGTDWFTYAAPFVVSSEGATTTYYRSTDNAGNLEIAKSLEINIDKASPSIIANVSPSPNTNGWYNTDVLVHFTAYDSLSGIDTVTPDIMIFAEGANQSVAGTAFDKAGNSASRVVAGINIDKSAPIISITSPMAGKYVQSEIVNIQSTSSDDLSGVYKSAVYLDGQLSDPTKPMDLLSLSLGTHTLKVESTNYAGLMGTSAVTFEVVIDFNGMIDIVKRLYQIGAIYNEGIMTSLVQKLEAAQSNQDAAINILNAFIRELNPQQMSGVAIEILKTDATYVIGHL